MSTPLFLRLRGGKGEHTMAREDPRWVVRPVCSHCPFNAAAYLLRRRVAPASPLDLSVEWRPWDSDVRGQQSGEATGTSDVIASGGILGSWWKSCSGSDCVFFMFVILFIKHSPSAYAHNTTQTQPREFTSANPTTLITSTRLSRQILRLTKSP